MNWLERWRQRQDLLSHGVDADLIRDNRKRYKLAFGSADPKLMLSRKQGDATCDHHC